VAVTEKPRTPPAQKTVSKPQAELGSALVEGARGMASSALERRPYLKMAFANPYNLSLFGGMLAAAGITLNPVLALAAVAFEALWLLHAPENKRLRHVLWDPRFDKLRETLEAQDRAKRLANVGPEERERVDGLIQRQKDIRALARSNRAFTADLLQGELVKTDRLVNAFIDMTVTCARYHQYLESVELDQLERDRRRYEAEVRNGPKDDPRTEVARKNLAILLKRIEKMKEIRNYLTVARGQLDLIENSFRLIQDQIVTMQSPQELSGQLDELLDGVEAIRESSRDTERMLSAYEV
jgi:hypothetical protein